MSGYGLKPKLSQKEIVEQEVRTFLDEYTKALDSRSFEQVSMFFARQFVLYFSEDEIRMRLAGTHFFRHSF